MDPNPDLPELDAATKARIQAEERYRAQLRAENASAVPVSAEDVSAAPVTPVPQAATLVSPAGPATPAPPVAPVLPAEAPGKKKAGCGTWVLGAVGVLVVIGVIGSFLPDDAATSASSASTSSSTSGQSARRSREFPQSVAGGAMLNRDRSQDIGVWNFSSVTWGTSRNVGGQFGSTAGAGETFVNVRFTLKNTTNETQNYSSLVDQPKLVLKDGSLIDNDTMLGIMGDGQVLDGQIAPGLKRTGTFSFRVPSDQTYGMRFQVQFSDGDYVEFPL